MRYLPKPAHDAEMVFRQCNSHVQDHGLRDSLETFASGIGNLATAYDTAGSGRAFHTMRPIPIPELEAAGITALDLKKAYTQRMVPDTSPGRAIYDSLLLSTPHRLCPLCGQRPVSTLDHYLPKDYFPELSVMPVNLVPACKDCNYNKLNFRPQTEDDSPLHPYYDQVDSEVWLFAEVEHTAPVGVRYYVERPAAWPVALGQRLARQFADLELGVLYASQAAVEISTMDKQMKDLFALGGGAAVAVELVARYESSRAALTNSWKTALYHALSHDPWYAATGVSL